MVLKPKQADLNKLNYPKIKLEGSHFVEDKIIDFDSIYIPLNDKEQRNNSSRGSFDTSESKNIAEALMFSYDYSEHPPIVYKLETSKIVNGKIYTYELISGFHRIRGLRSKGQNYWMFSVYKFDNAQTLYRFRNVANDHRRNVPVKKIDLVEHLRTGVAEGYLKNTEDDMRKELDYMRQVHPTMKNAAIKQAMRVTGARRDIVEFISEELEDYVKENSNYDVDTSPYQIGGKYDDIRDKHGYAVLTGYWPKTLVSAMAKHFETDKESYFLCHTRVPKENETLEQLRLNHMKEKEMVEKWILKTAKFYFKNGRFPWDIMAFYAQDNLKGEHGFISPEEIVQSTLEKLLEDKCENG